MKKKIFIYSCNDTQTIGEPPSLFACFYCGQYAKRLGSEALSEASAHAQSFFKVRLWPISNGKWGKNGTIPNFKTLLHMRAGMRCDTVRNSLTSMSFRKLTTPESKLTKRSQSLLSRSIPYFPLYNKHMIFHV